MKIICTQENLNKGLLIISNITGKNPNLPILNNILIKAKNNIITLSATNLEIGINCIIRGKIEKEGSFTVPARNFLDYISLISKNQVILELKDNKLEVSNSNFKSKFKGETTDDFPTIPKIKRQSKYTIKLEDMKSAISNVIFASTVISSRPEISGVLFNFNSDKKKLTLAATDSYRLAEKKINLIDISGKNEKIIIPIKTLQEVVRIIGLIKDIDQEDKKQKTINIYLSGDGQVLFTFPDPKIGTEDSIELVSRVIEGNYPEYQEIIPKSHNTKILVEKNNLIKIVKAGSLFTESGVNSIKLEFFEKDNEITVFSANSQTGENLSKLQAKIEGEDNSIVLNYRYLLEGLQNINGDIAVLEIINKDVPCLLKSIDKDDYIYIIMPIRL
ncbi:MAG: DNA polymerase III subunit beta [Xanthomonadaceae bacterium]|nr:DNA polymerase III subunit beta [Rhodospirillaceae bacterium]NIA17729.1 DNA polymerase III subunit beta [Xanthomonadaceae bacterium]